MKVSLLVVSGPHKGQAFTFEKHDVFIVGRAKYSHFHLPRRDKFFSRTHFMIEVSPPLCRLMDMASTNGTFVNRQRVSEVDLRHNDLITGGDTAIRVKIETDESDNVTRRTVVTPSSLGPLVATPRRTHIEAADGKAGRHTVAESPSPSVDDQPSDKPPGVGQTITEDFPQRLAHFRLIETVGSGGMGVVYKAENERTGEMVALKCIRPAGVPSRSDFKRFSREASILEEMSHSRIVRLFEQGDADGRLYFSMEFIDGLNASRLLAQHGPLSVARAVGLICQLLDALEYAHSLKFVHRDIKPENILVEQLSGKDSIKLADFGLARIYQESRLSGLTMHGEIGGSLAFMPPEQITNFRNVQPASDLYSVGATLYNLLTGRYTYDFPKPFNKRILTILQNEPTPIRDRRPDIRPDLAQAIHCALSRDPQRRFVSAKVMRHALLPFTKIS